MKILKEEIPASARIYKPGEPFEAQVYENRRITSRESRDDVRHIVLDISGSGIRYLEGQSIGVRPPGLDDRGKPHRVRLYSISSSRLGDNGLSDTVSITVKRVLYTDETGREVRGPASNYLCDLESGATVPISGPTGRTFFLPSDDTMDLIMVAVGTGIAPFRAFLHRLYRDHGAWKGHVRLFHGSRTGMESLYMNEENNDIGQYYEEKTFRAFQALSAVERVYVQKRIEENHAEIWNMIKKGNFMFYICGLKGMEEGVDQVFKKLAAVENRDWSEVKQIFQERGQWNIEVY